MPRAISGTLTIREFLDTQDPEVEKGLRDAIVYLDQLPHVLEGCPVEGHPNLREWLFDAAGKTWRITIDVRTGWPNWSVTTLAEL